MTALDDVTTGQRGIAGVVTRLAERFRPVTRRSVLVGAAVAGSALATKPREYALRPVTAYATICGPGNTASSGWTVFCCTINKGVNACPPGSFAAGWWRAAGSSWCGGGSRYIVDCNATCSKCTSGCSDHICDSRCWSCSCGTGSSATCDQRRVCCNAFRYGQCNTHVKCSGGVHCRVVSCVPPYHWANCTTTELRDDRTKEHSAPCLPQWSSIALKYRQMGELKSFLKASIGPERSVGDGRGRYVLYQGGVIYWSSATGARSMNTFIRQQHDAVGGVRGRLGYPVTDRYNTVRGGWLQKFERGAILDCPETATQAVAGGTWAVYQQADREWGVLGFPTGPAVSTHGGWVQTFEGGAIAHGPRTSGQVVAGWPYNRWQAYGREGGRLGFPRGPYTVANGGWYQFFEGGALADHPDTSTSAVLGQIYQSWAVAGRQAGVLRFPMTDEVTRTRGVSQAFQGGEIWQLAGSTAARRVHGAVLEEWKSHGGADGRYGWPVSDTTTTSDGRLTCDFEGGTITTMRSAHAERTIPDLQPPPQRG